MYSAKFCLFFNIYALLRLDYINDRKLLSQKINILVSQNLPFFLATKVNILIRPYVKPTLNNKK